MRRNTWQVCVGKKWVDNMICDIFVHVCRNCHINWLLLKIEWNIVQDFYYRNSVGWKVVRIGWNFHSGLLGWKEAYFVPGWSVTSDWLVLALAITIGEIIEVLKGARDDKRCYIISKIAKRTKIY